VANTLSDYTKAELTAYAEEFGVEVKAGMTKDAIVAAFDEDGVTVELIQAFHSTEEDETEDEVVDAPVVVEAAPVDTAPVLLKMTRTNRTYEVRGYRFTKEHPYALVDEDDADFLIETVGGFAMATPKEAREYYS
jgi:hypothetical protein